MPAGQQGSLIAIEGLDGSGKTTFGAALAERLGFVGRDVVLTQRNDVRELYNLQARLGSAGYLNTDLNCIWGAVELAARFHYVVRPALGRGATVLAAKYVVTAFAQGVARGSSLDFVSNMYDFAIRPDLVIYLDILPEVSLERKKRDGRGIGFYEAGLDVLLGLPLKTALMRFDSGQVADALLEESFLRFQSQLHASYDRLLTDYQVLRLDGTLPCADLVGIAVEALRTRV